MSIEQLQFTLSGVAVGIVLSALFWFRFIEPDSATALELDRQHTRDWRDQIDSQIHGDYTARRRAFRPLEPVRFECASGACGRCHACRNTTSVPVRFLPQQQNQQTL
jgi:hypothetical protein